MPSLGPDERNRRISRAQRAIERAVQAGAAPSLQDILDQAVVDDKGLGDGYFRALPSREQLKLSEYLVSCLHAHNSSQPRRVKKVPPEVPVAPDVHARRGNPSRTRTKAGSFSDPYGLPTPSPEDSASSARSQVSSSEASAPRSADSLDSDELFPTHADQVKAFDILFFIPTGAEFDFATQRQCEQRRSFVSIRILQRKKQLFDLARHHKGGQAILLTWKAIDPTAYNGNNNKTTSTWFRIVPDDKLDYDFALGSACNEPDDHEDKLDGNDTASEPIRQGETLAIGLEGLQINNGRSPSQISSSTRSTRVSDEMIDLAGRLNGATARFLSGDSSNVSFSNNHRLVEYPARVAESVSSSASTSTKSSRRHSHRKR